METLKSDIKKYLIDVKLYLPLPFIKRNKVIIKLKREIKQYIKDNNNISIADIINHFGMPEEIGESYLYYSDTTCFNNRLYNIRPILLIIIIFFIAILTLSSVRSIIHQKNLVVETSLDESINTDSDND